MDLTSLAAATEGLILERLPDGRFVRRGELPGWCLELPSPEPLQEGTPVTLDELFPYLDSYTEAAERTWTGDPEAREPSGFWTETGAGGQEIHLEALAAHTGDADVIVVARNERLYRERQLVLQRARDLRLIHDALLRELEQKDVLLHTIVHDLAAPLHGMLGFLSLLSEAPVAAPASEWIRAALQGARQQKQMIGEILEIFSVERNEHVAAAGPAPELREALDEVAGSLSPLAAGRRILLEVGPLPRPCLVAGDQRRLVRVIGNLIDNALRRSPPEGGVRVTVRQEGSWASIDVADQGPPVAAEQLARLFERVVPGQTRRGQGGLALYFCRITVERWGGGIGYEAEDGVCRFWVRLPLVEGDR
jgi:signal transduction histidine kinase